MQWIEKEKAAGMAVSAEMGTVYRKVLWRTVPFLFLCYVLNYMDLVNISVASYGFGIGIFFIGYVLFEVPSNLLMQRIGALVARTVYLAMRGTHR